MRFFDAFSGIGGFALPLTERGHTCVGYSEVDRFALSVYRRHFPEHDAYGDITKIKANSLPKFDLLVAGFPCQAFSVAGKRLGFSDSRGTLVFELKRILRVRRPRLFLFENVSGLLSHDNGRSFKRIVAALAQLGYDLQWQVLNSKDFGVPQNRERIYLVGHSRTTPRPKVFPLEIDDGEVFAEEENRLKKKCPPRDGRLSPRKKGASIRESSWTGRGCPVSVAARTRGGEVRFETRRDALANALRTSDGGSSKAFVAYRGHAINEPAGLSRTLKAGCHGLPGGEGLVRDGSWIRRLTPLECERLQGFPEGWTGSGASDNAAVTLLSDTQRYKCLGNAVTVNVVRAIVARLESSTEE